MGNYFDKDAMAHAKLHVSFHEAAKQDFVEGGDLVFIEETGFFDDYTEMNLQTMHAVKTCLRLKQKDLPEITETKQWCRMGIVVEEETVQIHANNAFRQRNKTLLELTDDGFKETDYTMRILQLKANQQTFAVRKLQARLSNWQRQQLRKIADFLVQLNGKSGMYDYKMLYDLSDEQIVDDWQKITGKKYEEKIELDRKMRRQQVKLQQTDSDEDEELENIGNPVEYLSLVKKALF